MRAKKTYIAVARKLVHVKKVSFAARKLMHAKISTNKISGCPKTKSISDDIII